MKRFLTLFLLALSISATAADKNFTLSSPDKKIRTNVTVGSDIQYSVYFNNTLYLLPSQISLSLQNARIIGEKPAIVKSSTRSVNEINKPLYGISEVIKEAYNELSIDFKGNYRIVFRAYNEGMAYRIETTLHDSVIVLSEQAD